MCPVSPAMKRHSHNCAFHILKQEQSPEVPKSQLFSFRLVPLSLSSLQAFGFFPIVSQHSKKHAAQQRPAECTSAVLPDFKTISSTTLILPHTHNNKNLQPSIRPSCFHNRQCYFGIFKLRSPSSMKLSTHKPF